MYSFLKKGTMSGSTEAGESSDDVSIAFSIDNDMPKKLGIPLRVDQRSAFDAEKIYRYQLEKDIVKLQSVYGKYKDRNTNFNLARAGDTAFAEINSNRPLGSGGNMPEVAAVTAAESWRATTKPFGEIAERKHKEWLKKKSPIISEEIIKKEKQKKQDNDLWDSIRFGYFEERRRQKKLTASEKEELAKAIKAKELEDYNRDLFLRNPKKYRLDRNLFTELRRKMTKREYIEAMSGWNKGHHPDHDFDKGFPKVHFVEENSARVGVVEEKVALADMLAINEAKRSKPELFISSRGEIGGKFRATVVERSFLEAEEYVKVSQRKILEDKERERRERILLEKGNQRRGHQIGANLRMDAIHALAAMAIKNEDKESHDGDSSEDDAALEEKLNIRKEALEAKAGAVSGPAVDGDESITKSVRFVDELSVGHESLAAGSSISSVGQMNFPPPASPTTPLLEAPPVPIIPEETFLERALTPMRHILEDIDEVGLLRYSNRIKKLARRRIGAGLSRAAARCREGYEAVMVPLRRIKKLFQKERVTPYEVPDEDDGEKLPAFEVALAKLQAEVDELSVADKMAEKFEVKGANEDSRNKRKRKLANLRKRLEAKAALAVEMRRLAAEAAAKKARDEELQKATEALEQAKEKVRLVHQLQETIKFAHRSMADAALKMGGKIAIENKDGLNHSYLKEKLSKKAIAESQRLLQVIMLMRAKERDKSTWLRDQFDFILGPASSHLLPPSVTELVLAIQAGDVNAVIDIVDTVDGPIHPNDQNKEGISGMYAMLIMLLNDDKAQAKHSALSKVETDFEEYLNAAKKLVFGVAQKEVVNLALVLQLLLYKGGDLNVIKRDPEGDGWGVMHHAASQGSADFIEWMNSLGASVHLPSTVKQLTPLMCAARKDQLATVMMLLKCGAIDSIEAVDSDGWNVIHHAASYASPVLLHVLLLCGGKGNVRNKAGYSPTDEAQSRHRGTSVEILRTFTAKKTEHMERIHFFEELYKEATDITKFEQLMSLAETGKASKPQVAFADDNESIDMSLEPGDFPEE